MKRIAVIAMLLALGCADREVDLQFDCLKAGGSVVQSKCHPETMSTGKRSCKVVQECTWTCVHAPIVLPAEAPYDAGTVR